MSLSWSRIELALSLLLVRRILALVLITNLLPLLRTSAQDRNIPPSKLSQRLVTRVGHSGWIEGMAFSRDGKLLASLGVDHKIIIWTTASGEAIQTIRVQQAFLFPAILRFSGDATRIFWADISGIRAQRLGQPNKIETIVNYGGVATFNVSRDGRWLSLGDVQGRVQISSLAKPQALRELSRMGAPVSSIAFDSKSTVLAIGDLDGNVTSYDLQREAKMLDHQKIGGFLSDLNFDSEGRLFAITNVARDDDRSHAPRPELVSFVPKVWDLSRGTQIGDFGDFKANRARITSDCRWVITSRAGDPTKPTELAVWHLFPFEKVPYETNSYYAMGAFAMSGDGALIASAFEGERIQVQERASGNKLPQNSGPIDEVLNLRFLGQSPVLATSGHFETAYWDFVRGEAFHFSKDTIFGSNIDGNLFVYFEPATNNTDPRLRIVARLDNRQVNELNLKGVSGVSRIVVSPTGQKVVWVQDANSQTSIDYWDCPTGRRGRLCYTDSRHSDLQLSWSGSIVVTGCSAVNREDAGLSVWESDHFSQIAHFKEEYARLAAISKDERFVAIAGTGPNGTLIRVHDLSKRRSDYTLGSQEGLVQYRGISFAIPGSIVTATSRFTRAGNEYSSIDFWDPHSNRITRRIRNTEGVFTSLAVTSDGAILAGTTAGTANLYHPLTTELLIQMVPVGANDWLAITPDGLFDGSAGALQWVGWRLQELSQTLPLSFFYNDFFSPGLLATIASEKLPEPPRKDLASSLRIPGLRSLVEARLAHVEFKGGHSYLCLPDPPTTDILKGIHVATSKGTLATMNPEEFTRESKIRTDCSFRKELPFKEGEFAVGSAFSPTTESNEPGEHPISTVESSTLRVLTVGISSYPEKSSYSRLPAAATDARAIEKFFRNQKQLSDGPFGDRIDVADGLYDATATQAAIRDSLTQLARRTREEDVVVLFFSGHGVVWPGEEMFYFVPVDGDPQSLGIESQSAISTASFADLVRNLPAKRVILVIDSCQSGAALDSLKMVATVKKLIADRFGFRREIPAGILIVASATPFQEAIELEHGVLARAFLDILQNDTQTKRSEVVWARDLAQLKLFVKKATSDSPQQQTPLMVFLGSDFPLSRAKH
jgi:WD40 repeat protein